jgi:hypothetical protein
MMKRLLVGLSLSVVVSASFGGTSAQAAGTLVATVDANSIAVRSASGQPVARVSAGRYTIVVRDRSSRQNFHLSYPPMVDKRTTLRFKGTMRWTLNLVPGVYSFRSDASRRLRGTIRVA